MSDIATLSGMITCLMIGFFIEFFIHIILDHYQYKENVLRRPEAKVFRIVEMLNKITLSVTSSILLHVFRTYPLPCCRMPYPAHLAVIRGKKHYVAKRGSFKTGFRL